MLGYSILAVAAPTLAADFESPLEGINSLGTLIDVVMTFLMGFIGVIAVVYLVYSGFKYVTAGGDSKKAGEAKEGITHAIIGIAIALIGFLLVDQVFKLLNFNGTWNQID